MGAPRTIDDIVAELDQIVAAAVETGSPRGYFPALYRRVTLRVKEEIARGAFDDNARMERFDVIFAQRYLDAFHAFQGQSNASASWQRAFASENDSGLIVLQHLLLGMNAHISFDLGISAAEAADGDILSLKNDFMRINQILGSLLDDTQSRLTWIFGPLDFTDRLLGSIDESLSIFSLEYARDKAWTQALELAAAETSTKREKLLRIRDEKVAAFSDCLQRPRSWRIRCLLRLVRWLERGDVPWRIRCLTDARRPAPLPKHSA